MKNLSLMPDPLSSHLSIEVTFEIIIKRDDLDEVTPT